LVNVTMPRKRKWLPWAPTLVALISILIVACGTAATPTSAPPEPTNTTAAGPADTQAPVETPDAAPTPRPTGTVASRDDIAIVINEEPNIPDPWISTTLYPNQVVQNVAQPFAFFGPEFTDVATAGFTGFEQMDPTSGGFLSERESPSTMENPGMPKPPSTLLTPWEVTLLSSPTLRLGTLTLR
jgi:hypothetical protein